MQRLRSKTKCVSCFSSTDFSSLTPPVVKKHKKNSKVKTKAEITEKKDVIVKKKERIRIER